MEVSKEPTKPIGHARAGTHQHFMPVICHANLYLVLMFSNLIFTKKFNPDAH